MFKAKVVSGLRWLCHALSCSASSILFKKVKLMSSIFIVNQFKLHFIHQETVKFCRMYDLNGRGNISNYHFVGVSRIIKKKLNDLVTWSPLLLVAFYKARLSYGRLSKKKITRVVCDSIFNKTNLRVYRSQI